jgi:lactate dehydrogenase-like 2-hydroxyacid dehydrogenase
LAEFEILMPFPMHPLVITNLESWAVLHKLWEAPDIVAMTAAIKDRVRGMASSYGARKIDAELIGQFPKLEIIAHFGVGYDIVDVDYAAAHGVVVTNTPDVLNEEVADVAMGLLIATVRQFPQADRFVRGGHWLKGNFPLTASLRGRTMGIFGLGRIGKAIARRAEAFGVKVLYTGRNPQKDVAYPYIATLKGLAEACDILMVVAPATAETKHAVNAEVLSALGPDGILINIARGSLVDEAALIEALREKRILSAGLDVFENEPNVPQALIDMDHIVLLPHVGSASHVTRQAMGQLVCDNLKSYAEGKGPLTPVPETPFPAKRSSQEIA